MSRYIVGFFMFCAIMVPVISPMLRLHAPTAVVISGAEGRQLRDVDTPPSSHDTHMVCGFPSWRDNIYFLDYMAYFLYLTSTTFNWYLLVYYVFEDRIQGYLYFASAMLSSSAVFFQSCILPKHLWEFVKLITGWLVFSISVALDNMTYRHHNHYRLTVAFVLLYGLAVLLIHSKYSNAAEIFIPVINRASNLFSVLLLSIGVAFHDRWVYTSLDVYAAVLTAIYSVFGLIDSCDPASRILVVLTILIRLVHGYLLVSRVFRQAPEDPEHEEDPDVTVHEEAPEGSAHEESPEGPVHDEAPESPTPSFNTQRTSISSFFSVFSHVSGASGNEEPDQDEPSQEEESELSMDSLAMLFDQLVI